MREETITQILSIARCGVEENNSDQAAWDWSVINKAEAELERRHKPIRRDELLENGPWRPGPDDAINCFVRSGVSLTLFVHPAYSIAVIKNQFSDGRTSPNVNLYSMADLDDFIRLSSQPPMPMPEFSIGEQPIT